MKHSLLVFATLAALAPTALAQDAQKAIQTQYDKRSAAALKKEVSNLKDSESLMRARAADFAQKLFQYKKGGIKELDGGPVDLGTLTIAEVPEQVIGPTSGARPKSTSTRSRPSSSRSSNGGSFFQRLFGRR